MVSAGEPLNAGVIEAFREVTGLEVADGYGQTETGHIAGNHTGEPVVPGSMGRPLPGFETRIVEGELQLRAASCPTFFSGYLDDTDDAAAARLLEGEWWPTGTSSARARTATSSSRAATTTSSSPPATGSGRSRSSRRWSRTLPSPRRLPSPHPIPSAGEVVRAIVVLRDGQPSERLAAELQEHCKRTTAPYKFPRIVEFAEELPKTASGKIKWAQLRRP